MSDTYHQPPHPALTEAQINIAVLKSELDSMKREMQDMRNTLTEVRDLLTEARGGWRFMMLLGGGAATIGSVLTWLMTHTFTVGPK